MKLMTNSNKNFYPVVQNQAQCNSDWQDLCSYIFDELENCLVSELYEK
jgi:hypothetical protein